MYSLILSNFKVVLWRYLASLFLWKFRKDSTSIRSTIWPFKTVIHWKTSLHTIFPSVFSLCCFTIWRKVSRWSIQVHAVHYSKNITSQLDLVDYFSNYQFDCNSASGKNFSFFVYWLIIFFIYKFLFLVESFVR